jgi:hypothetical protein
MKMVWPSLTYEIGRLLSFLVISSRSSCYVKSQYVREKYLRGTPPKAIK